MQPDTLLDAVLDEAGISHAGLAAHVNQAGWARGLSLGYEHTAVAHWLKGQRPRGQVPDLICEVLAARLHRQVALDDIGLGVPGGPSTPHPVRSPASSGGPPRCGAPISSGARTCWVRPRSPAPPP